LLAWSCFHYSVFTIFVRFLSFTKKTGFGITLYFRATYLVPNFNLFIVFYFSGRGRRDDY
jgi:hypothetical protein